MKNIFYQNLIFFQFLQKISKKVKLKFKIYKLIFLVNKLFNNYQIILNLPNYFLNNLFMVFNQKKFRN